MTDPRRWEEVTTLERLIEITKNLGRDYIDRVALERLEDLYSERQALLKRVEDADKSVREWEDSNKKLAAFVSEHTDELKRQIANERFVQRRGQLQQAAHSSEGNEGNVDRLRQDRQDVQAAVAARTSRRALKVLYETLPIGFKTRWASWLPSSGSTSQPLMTAKRKTRSVIPW